MKRLTVHFRNAPKLHVRKGKEIKQCIYNTRAFIIDGSADAIKSALSLLQREGRIITKHYLSNV